MTEHLLRIALAPAGLVIHTLHGWVLGWYWIAGYSDHRAT